MKIICVVPEVLHTLRLGALSMGSVSHPDQKRQRCVRLRSLERFRARQFKSSRQAEWLPALPETHAWEKWFDTRGWHNHSAAQAGVWGGL